MISPQIVIDDSGTEATGFWYLWEAATLPNEHSNEAEAYWIGGTYDVRFRLEGGKWLFSKVELKLNMASPIAEGWVKKRWPDGTASQPYFAELEAGKTYYWRRGSREEGSRLVDGPDADGPPTVAFTVEETGTHPVCGCGYSKTRPLCDGSHLNLKYDWSLLGKVRPEPVR
jgi:CDGSH-type Zn-finger protein